MYYKYENVNNNYYIQATNNTHTSDYYHDKGSKRVLVCFFAHNTERTFLFAATGAAFARLSFRALRNGRVNRRTSTIC